MSLTIKELELNVKSLMNKEGFSKDIFTRFNHLLGEVWETSKEVNELLNAEDDDIYAEEVRNRLGKELFDVIWNAIALAKVSGVDIEKAITDKIKHNKKRFKGKVKHFAVSNSYGFKIEGSTKCGIKYKTSLNTVFHEDQVSCVNCLKTMRGTK